MTEYLSNRVSVTNTSQGILIVEDNGALELTVPHAQGMHLHLGQALAIARGYSEEVVLIQDVDPDAGDKIKLGGDTYKTTSLLQQLHGQTLQYVLQWDDDEGEQCELIVPEDFMVTVWRVIE